MPKQNDRGGMSIATRPALLRALVWLRSILERLEPKSIINLVIGLYVFAFITWGFLRICCVSAEALGQFGDYFGALNAFTSLLAFLMVYAALQDQKVSTALQAESTKMQAEELSENREFLKKQMKLQFTPLMEVHVGNILFSPNVEQDGFVNGVNVQLEGEIRSLGTPRGRPTSITFYLGSIFDSSHFNTLSAEQRFGLPSSIEFRMKDSEYHFTADAHYVNAVDNWTTCHYELMYSNIFGTPFRQIGIFSFSIEESNAKLLRIYNNAVNRTHLPTDSTALGFRVSLLLMPYTEYVDEIPPEVTH